MYLFDTYAIIELLLSNPNYKEYKRFPVITTYLNAGEFYIFLRRTYGKETADEQIKAYSFEFVPMTEELVLKAAKFKEDNSPKRLSWADCIGYTAAKQLKLKFLTGDKEFKGMENVEYVK